MIYVQFSFAILLYSDEHKHRMLYALADANNFYCSVERVFQPRLQNRPVVVLSNNDGCIISRSNEVKAMGISMGEPFYKVKLLCLKNDVAIFSSNYALYGDMSQRLMHILSGFSPNIEVYSIDEAFLDLSRPVDGDPLQYARHIRQKVLQYLGLPVAIGIGPTKTLCKLANFIAKKFTSDSVFLLSQASQIHELIQDIPVSEVWGIGRRSQKKLQYYGIFSVYDFYHANPNHIRQLLGIGGVLTQRELKGHPSQHLQYQPQSKKTIISSRSFSRPIGDLQSLHQALANYVVIAGQKLRHQQQLAQALCVFLHTNIHHAKHRQYHNSITLALDTASNDSHILLRAARRGLQDIYKAGYMYQKVGVILLDLRPQQQPQQQQLFTSHREHKRKKQEKLMQTIDLINQKMGNHRVFFASQGIQRHWQLRRDYRSPCYTTQWQELPLVR